jgi:hypothetical protein
MGFMRKASSAALKKDPRMDRRRLGPWALSSAARLAR